MRGKVTADDEPIDSKVKAAKVALTIYAFENFELSWAIGRFHEPERWAMKWYTVRFKEECPGALFVTDDDTETDVVVYAQKGVDWHSVRLEYFYEGKWSQFVPQIALAEWKAGHERWALCPNMPRDVRW